MIAFETYTEWRGNEYVTTTKVYDTAKLVPGWVGCHWDNPAIIASEAVEGTNMSDDMLAFIEKVGAVEIEDEGEFEECSPSSSEAVEDDWSIEELLEKGYMNEGI